MDTKNNTRDHNNSLIIQAGGGNVGIGTTTPESMVEVYCQCHEAHPLKVESGGEWTAEIKELDIKLTHKCGKGKRIVVKEGNLLEIIFFYVTQ